MRFISMLVTFGDIILNVPATKIMLLSICNPLIVIKIKIMLIAIIVVDFLS